MYISKPDICNILDWCDDNRMAINYDKTKAILITTCQQLHTLPVKDVNITVKGTVFGKCKTGKATWLSSRPKSVLEFPYY